MAWTWRDVAAAWTGLPAARRTLILIAAGAVALTAAAAPLVLRGSETRYATLYAHLQPAAEQAVEQRLALDGVPFQAGAGGSVLVPAAQAAEERMALAEVGLPETPAGLSSLASLPFTASGTQRQAAYVQAVQGELEKSVDAITGVGRSQVRIAMNQPSPYSGQSTAGSASVLVDLLPGAALSGGQVGAIQHLVAYAVPGLKPNLVAVVDQAGTLLRSSAGAAGSSTASGDTMAAEQRYDAALQSKILDQLGQLYGAGNVSVSVGSRLDLTRQSATIHTYASSGTPRSTQATRQTWTGNPPAGAAGVPGAATNTPTYGVPGTTGASGQGNGTVNSTTTDYDVSETTRTISPAPLTVRSLGIAVALNRARLGAAQIGQVKRLVQTVAADPAATVTVVALAFSKASAPVASPGSLPLTQLAMAGAGLAVLAVAFALWLSSRRRRQRVKHGFEVNLGPRIGRDQPEETEDERLTRVLRESADEDMVAVVRVLSGNHRNGSSRSRVG